MHLPLFFIIDLPILKSLFQRVELLLLNPENRQFSEFSIDSRKYSLHSSAKSNRSSASKISSVCEIEKRNDWICLDLRMNIRKYPFH